MSALVTLDAVSVRARGEAALENFSLAIAPGETVVLLGEPDCGKDEILQLLAGVPLKAEIAGTIRIRDGQAERAARFRGRGLRTAYLAGPYAQPFSPHASVAAQAARVIARKLDAPRPSARAEFGAALERLAGAPPLATFDALPGALGPEMLAWGLFAAAFAGTPDLLLADDPLSRLSPTQARAMAALLQAEQKRLGFALVYAAMSTEVVRWLGGRIVVLRHGKVVEEGPLSRLATAQAHAYTRTLFRAAPSLTLDAEKPRSQSRAEPVLQVHALEWRKNLEPRETVTFELRRGRALAFVGEKGSGRHALMRALLGLERVEAGHVVLDAVDIGILSEGMLMRLRRRVAFVTGSDEALDPRMLLWDTVTEPLRAHLRLPRGVIAESREAALKRVGMAGLKGDVPVAALSPFDRRRLQVARAIVGAPLLAVIDEPFHGLDAFAQSVMRDLLREFRESEGPAFLVITSDVAVAQALAEDAFVFAGGRIVERGSLAGIVKAPKAPQTKRLIEAVRPQETLSPPPSGG